VNSVTIKLTDHNEFYHKIYHESCAEFEEVRELCLSEDNWLREIYTPQSLILENHVGYGVVYHKATNEPVVMAGLFNDGRYPANIARHMHRGYLFPKFRQRNFQGIVDSFRLYDTHLIKPLNLIKQFDAYFIAIQDRNKKETKGYWNVMSSAICTAIPGFTPGICYVQTCPFDVQQCWQHHVYYEHVLTAWTGWNKRFVSDEQWAAMPRGT
jgi:hypothetical protein